MPSKLYSFIGSVILIVSAAMTSGAADPLAGRVAGSVPKGSIWEEHWLFRKSVLESSPEVDFEYYFYGELGNEDAIVNGLRRNRIQISSASLWGLSAAVPEVAVLSLPYLFESPEEADFIYDCCAADIMRPYLEAIGIAFLGWSEAGWTGFYGQKPFSTPDAVKGERLRSPSTPSVARFFGALGVDTVFLGIGDVVPALQTGMVDGGASSLPWYVNAFKDHAPHYTLTGHHYETSVLMASKPWLDGATPEQQKVIRDAFNVFATQRVTVRKDSEEKVNALRAADGFVYDLKPEQRARWIAAAQAAHPEILRDIGGDAETIYAQILAAKANFKVRQGQKAAADN